jgi:hypothetical protein
MAAASEHNIALSMIRLWGGDAKEVATKYAREFECLDNFAEADRWYAVQRIVAHWHGLTRLPSKDEGYVGFVRAYKPTPNGRFSMPHRL